MNNPTIVMALIVIGLWAAESSVHAVTKAAHATKQAASRVLKRRPPPKPDTAKPSSQPNQGR